jgi:PPOX class probable F420-dependent enzyme
MLNLNTTTEFGERVARRLRDEIVVWLTTVRADHTPQPSPVWFLWDGEAFLIYSRPQTQKLRNIERHPVVAVNLNSDGQGDDNIIITGEARVVADAPPATQVAAYIAKYEQPIAHIQMTPDSFAAAYSVAIRITPTGIRGF